MVTAYVLVAVVFISGSVLLNGFLYRYAENISGQSRSANYAVYNENCLRDGTSYRTAGVLNTGTVPTTLLPGVHTVSFKDSSLVVSETDWRADFNNDGDRRDMAQTTTFELSEELNVEYVDGTVAAVHHAGICWQIISPDE